MGRKKVSIEMRYKGEIIYNAFGPPSRPNERKSGGIRKSTTNNQDLLLVKDCLSATVVC